MARTSTDRPINLHRITPEDWQSYIKKLFESVPGSSLAEKHEWLSTKLGVSPGTTAAWLNKGQGTPNSDSQFAMSDLLGVPLAVLITQVQLRLDPPPLTSGKINRKIIEAISVIPPSEISMTAKSLGNITQAQLYAAASNLMLIARCLD